MHFVSRFAWITYLFLMTLYTWNRCFRFWMLKLLTPVATGVKIKLALFFPSFNLIGFSHHECIISYSDMSKYLLRKRYLLTWENRKVRGLYTKYSQTHRPPSGGIIKFTCVASAWACRVLKACERPHIPSLDCLTSTSHCMAHRHYITGEVVTYFLLHISCL